MSHETFETIIENTWEVIKDLFIGFSSSWTMTLVIPEIIHGVASVITGLTVTVLVFFVNKWLKKKFNK